MAENIIEVLIKSAVTGNETVAAFVKQLESLRKEGELTEDQFTSLTAAFKEGISAGISSEIQKITGDLRNLRDELVKTGKSTADVDKLLSLGGGAENVLKVSEAYKASLKAVNDSNQQGSASYRILSEAASNYNQTLQETKAQTTVASTTTKDLSGSFSLLTGRQLGVNRVLGLGAAALSDMGPAGQIASNAILQVVYSGLRLGANMALIGAAVGAVTTGIALLIKHLKEAKEKKEEFDAASRTSNLSYFANEIFKVDTALIALSTRLDDVNSRIAAQRAAGVTDDGFLKSLKAGLEQDKGTKEAERATAVNEQQSILALRAQQAGLAIEAQTAAIDQNVREVQKLNHEMRVASILQGEVANAADKTKQALIEQSAILRDKTIAKEVKDQTDAVKASMDSLIKSRADAAAASQQMLYDTTGSLAALQRSFGATRQGIIASTAADLARQLEQNKLPELESGIKQAATERQRIQLLGVQQQQERAMFQYREQARAIEITQLATLENQARVTLEVEQSRLNTLHEQNAPISQQDAQLVKVQNTEQALIRATISRLEGTRALLRLTTLQGNQLEEEKFKEQQINNELVKQNSLLESLNAKRNTPAINQDRLNRLAGIRQEIQDEQEIEAFRGSRAVEVQSRELDLRKQSLELQRQMDLAAVSSPRKHQILEINLGYERMREALEELVQKYPELATVAETTLERINAAHKQAVANAANTSVQLLQSLSDAFVNSIDQAFDELFDNTRSFGEKINSFMLSLGQTILKTLLHNVITIPLQEMMKETFDKLRASMAGGGSLLDSLMKVLSGGATGTAATAVTPAAATAVSATQSLTQAVSSTTTSALALNNAAFVLSSAGGLLSTAATALAEAAVALAACCGGGGGKKGVLTGGKSPDLENEAGDVVTEEWDQMFNDFSNSVSTASDQTSSSLESMSEALASTDLSISDLGLDTDVLSRGFDFLSNNLGKAASALFDFISSFGEDIGSGLGSIFGGLASLFGGKSAPVAMGHGGMVIPSGIMLPAYANSGGLSVPKNFIRPFQSGGTATRPTLGIIGEEGPEIVARMKPARAMDEEKVKGSTTVIINGDITPKKPDMKPEDVIKIIENDGVNGGSISKMTTTIIKRNR